MKSNPEWSGNTYRKSNENNAKWNGMREVYTTTLKYQMKVKKSSTAKKSSDKINRATGWRIKQTYGNSQGMGPTLTNLTTPMEVCHQTEFNKWLSSFSWTPYVKALHWKGRAALRQPRERCFDFMSHQNKNQSVIIGCIEMQGNPYHIPNDACWNGVCAIWHVLLMSPPANRAHPLSSLFHFMIRMERGKEENNMFYWPCITRPKKLLSLWLQRNGDRHPMMDGWPHAALQGESKAGWFAFITWHFATLTWVPNGSLWTTHRNCISSPSHE